MVDLAEAPTADPSRRRGPRRWTVILLAAIAVLLVGGAVTAVSVADRYRHADVLITAGGGWEASENVHLRRVVAGPTTALIVSPRPGHAQTFHLTLFNPSSVSQTLLGLTDGADLGDPRTKAEPVHLRISSTPTFPEGARITYTDKPVVIAPHGQYTLMFTNDTDSDWSECRSEYWTSLSLQVRVGIFTRTETLDFDNLVFELQAPGADC